MHENTARPIAHIICILFVLGTLGMSKVSAESLTAIVIHGGAGTITRASMTDEKEAAIRAVLEESIKAGYRARHPIAPGNRP